MMGVSIQEELHCSHSLLVSENAVRGLGKRECLMIPRITATSCH